jgi:ribose-phosphate pyrophosphokinase
MLIFSLDGQDTQELVAVLRELSEQSLNSAEIQQGELVHRHFPDGESYLNILSNVEHQDVVVVCQLHQPNDKLIDLMLFSETVRQQGARTVSLVAPYLAYMRQDIKFQPGECISSRHVAQWLSERFDSIITIDPHLHRYKQLDEIYSIKNSVIHATDIVADFIRETIDNPIVIGPDSESEQWASSVAEQANCDAIVLNKIRHGDRDVEVSAPDLKNYLNHQPILIDDIISTGKTMIKAAENIVKLGGKAPICIGVHGVFSDGAFAAMQQADIAEIITCNTIAHPSNKISIIPKLAKEILTMQSKLKEKSNFQFNIQLKGEL